MAVFGERAEVRVVVVVPDRVQAVGRLLFAGELPGFLGGALVAELALTRQLGPRGLSLAARGHLEHLHIRGDSCRHVVPSMVCARDAEGARGNNCGTLALLWPSGSPARCVRA